MKRFYASLAALTLVFASILFFNLIGANSNAASLPRDCDKNSIIYCGSVTPSELASKYTANKTGDLPAIYHSYGLSDTEMTHAGTYAKMGEVHKDGTVTVNGKVVATGAISLGRQAFNSHRLPVVINGKTYYQSATQYSFGIESIVAFVFFNSDGSFQAAVLTSCNNPVRATPVPLPKPQPQYTCTSLTSTPISRTERTFTAKASAANGAVIVSYTYNFGDGTTATTPSATQGHTYAAPGAYTATMAANVKVNGQTIPVSGASCQTSVIIAPPTPAYACTALTVTPIDRTTVKFATTYTSTNATFKSLSYVIRDSTGATIATVAGPTYAQATPGTYSAQAMVTFTVNGKDVTVTADTCKQPFTIVPENMVQVCNQTTGQVITVPVSQQGNYKPVGDVACTPVVPTPPVTPTQLPHTGAGSDLIGGTVGLGSLVAAVSYYIASRRGLLAQLLGR